MKSAYAFAAALVLAASPAIAAVVPLPVKLADGATWTQTVAHTEINESGGKTSSYTLTQISKATLSLPKDGPAILRQDFLSASASEGAPEFIAKSVDFKHPVVLEVNERLVPTRIVNWTELRGAMTAFTAELLKDPKAVKAMEETYSVMSDVQAAGVLLKEFAMLGVGQGSEMEVGKPINFEDHVPNAFGGEPILTKSAFRLISYDAKAGRAVVTWTQVLDTASASTNIRIATEALLARTAPQDVEKTRAALKDLVFDRSDACRYEIDVASGLAVNAECSNVITSGVAGKVLKRTDRYVITQTLPEAR